MNAGRPKLNFSLFLAFLRDSEGQHSLSYDPAVDILIIRAEPMPSEEVVQYVDDHVGLLYEPERLTVVGLQIEAFVHSYLPGVLLDCKPFDKP